MQGILYFISFCLDGMRSVLNETHAVIFYLRNLHLLPIILSLGCKIFISASPKMQWYCRLVMKKVFWTHTFAVGLIDMGNSAHKPKIVNESLHILFYARIYDIIIQ